MLYLALYQSYIKKLTEKHPNVITILKNDIMKVSSNQKNSGKYDCEKVLNNYNSLLDLLIPTKYADIQHSLDDNFKGQPKFLRNYMIIFETLLLFVRATREQNWELHLSVLNELNPYFFAFDMIKISIQ